MLNLLMLKFNNCLEKDKYLERNSASFFFRFNLTFIDILANVTLVIVHFQLNMEGTK